MKRFIIQTGLFSLIPVSLFLVILCTADGYTDATYLRFTTPKQENLIFGTSRAAQGLRPTVFSDVLNKEFYNYAFTVADSPYGEIYLNSIKKKVAEKNSSGTFILSVDPWSISSISENPNDSAQFREKNYRVALARSVNSNPNFEFLMQKLKGDYFSIITNRFISPMFLHEDGWLELSVDMESSAVKRRVKRKVKEAEENRRSYKYSSLRFKYLQKTIQFLKKHGKVYLVRLPIHASLMDIEQEFMPDFNDKMKEIIPMTDGYFDMSSSHDKYAYIDGSHLHKDSGKEVSLEIAEWINAEVQTFNSKQNKTSNKR